MAGIVSLLFMPVARRAKRGSETLRFTILGTAFGLFLLGAGLLFWRWVPKHRDLWRSLPRERTVGTVLGFFCLTWSAFLAAPLLEGGLAPLRRLLPVVVILVTVGSWYCLDYVLTRALGGFLLLAANFLLHEAFVAHAALRPVLSVALYLVVGAGMIMIAYPYRFRDLLEKGATNGRLRGWVSGVLAVVGAVIAILSLATHG